MRENGSLHFQRRDIFATRDDDLLAFLKLRLGKFKLPRIIEISAEPLPKTGTGKIRKNELRERFWTGKDKRVQG